jgi:hypothetical protein
MTHSIFSKPRTIGIGLKPGNRRDAATRAELERARRRADIRDRLVAIMRERADRIAAGRERGGATLH